MSETAGEFRMVEGHDSDGWLRLSLLGELDLAVADDLAERLGELSAGGAPLRLDLSRLEFIDSSGLRGLLAAVAGARRDDRPLEICPELSDQVARLLDLADVRGYLWPTAD